jgi:ATP-dependent DNA helicase RecG
MSTLTPFLTPFSITLLSQPCQEKQGSLNVPLNEGLNGGLSGGLNEGLKSLLKAISDNPGIQAKTLAESLRRPIKTVEKQIKTLTDKNLIERRGSKKTGGYWAL